MVSEWVHKDSQVGAHAGGTMGSALDPHRAFLLPRVLQRVVVWF